VTDALAAVLSWRTALLRTEIDAVLADWAWHLDHGDYDALAGLFTADALFVTGEVELRGRAAIKNRYTERVVARSTRHVYSGLRISPVEGDREPGTASGSGADVAGGRPARVRARSTWVNYAVNAPAPVDDVGVYLVADFDDVLTWCDDERWRISERHISPVFRDPARAPVTG
jgi:ketosteroid isomerase-like protein